MKSKLKTVWFMFAMVAAGMVSGCGSSGGGTTAESGSATPSGSLSASPTASTVDGAALYTANCAGCHGALATSAKKGATAAQIQIRMSTTPYSTRTLTPAEVQAIAAALAIAPPSTTTPPPATTTPPTTTTPPAATTVDGAALYAENCASCHGVLAASAKRGATAAEIQVRMDAPPYATRTLTTAEVQAMATALAATPTTTTPPPTTTTPPTTAACGSCHAIPPATGEHAFHTSRRVACATCHGSGFSTTTVNSATHNNGVKNLTTTIGWNASSRSCANSCHGNQAW